MANTGSERTRTRAPRNSLSAELILDRALHLLDTKGLDAFSMRSLADDLGVGTMALYTYFRGRDELFRAARDRVLADYSPPEAEGTWDERLRLLCLALYGLFAERPAVLRLLTEAKEKARHDFGDSATGTLERMLSLLRESGMEREECARSCSVLLQYTVGAALRRLHAVGGGGGGPVCPGAGAGASAGAVAAAGAGLAERLDPERHPTLTEMLPILLTVRGGGEEQYAFGLDLIIAGLRERSRRAARATRGPDAKIEGRAEKAAATEGPDVRG
ncbi:TetR/AcrR family transcriptional regulator [Phaeacidiphilus oryzae]|uniref:TetR/AcrR family transcriptional regulator n=1 Tax=Phaeacidiphilus oryzae TaxID=348818 RepID=UPI000692150A|nr:TetR/AcrR family transcriptional regulator C-terminal domain-containing protein [Phaeacidiphilus oryzae]